MNATPSPKITGSGEKLILVPFFRVGPSFSIGPTALPRVKAWRHSKPSFQAVTSTRSLSAFTTETPTPCRPPEVS